MPSLHEQLTQQFFRWEQRGRGWQVYDEPVYPEPPFVPFDGHYQPEEPLIDDGHRPSLLGSLFWKVAPPPAKKAAPPTMPQQEEEPEPTPLTRESLVEFQASLPEKLDVDNEAFAQFLLNLSLCREHSYMTLG